MASASLSAIQWIFQKIGAGIIFSFTRLRISLSVILLVPLLVTGIIGSISEQSLMPLYNNIGKELVDNQNSMADKVSAFESTGVIVEVNDNMTLFEKRWLVLKYWLNLLATVWTFIMLVYIFDWILSKFDTTNPAKTLFVALLIVLIIQFVAGVVHILLENDQIEGQGITKVNNGMSLLNPVHGFIALMKQFPAMLTETYKVAQL